MCVVEQKGSEWLVVIVSLGEVRNSIIRGEIKYEAPESNQKGCISVLQATYMLLERLTSFLSILKHCRALKRKSKL